MRRSESIAHTDSLLREDANLPLRPLRMNQSSYDHLHARVRLFSHVSLLEFPVNKVAVGAVRGVRYSDTGMRVALAMHHLQLAGILRRQGAAKYVCPDDKGNAQDAWRPLCE